MLGSGFNTAGDDLPPSSGPWTSLTFRVSGVLLEIASGWLNQSCDTDRRETEHDKIISLSSTAVSAVPSLSLSQTFFLELRLRSELPRSFQMFC